MVGLKELRIEKKMTQQEVADLVGISLRSYKSYENDEEKQNTIKYNYIVEQLSKINQIDEETGILEIEDIVRKCTKVFERYEVRFCYLFGSYARGEASGDSDLDFLVFGGKSFKKTLIFALAEELREVFDKPVDVYEIHEVNQDSALYNTIMKEKRLIA